jgi:chromosome segregation ATPase
LDLQAASQEVRDAWIEGLASLLSTSVEFHGWPISTAELGTVTTLTDKATVTNLEKELAARTQTVDDLTKDLTAVRVDLGELEKLTEHVARADEHAKRADQRISELERERDGLEEALDQTEGADHDADMQLRITSLQSELANSQALIAKKEELDQQVATMSVELEAFRQSAASFKQEHLTLRERISSLDRERESMQVALGEAQEAAAARATLQPAFSASVPKVEEARTLLMEAEAKHEATTGRLKMEAASLWTRLQTEIDHNAGEQKRQAEEVVRRQSLGEEQATRVVVNLKRKIEELQARSLQAEQSSQTSVVVSEEMTALRVENRRLTEALRLSTVEEAASDTAGGETVSEAVDVVAAVGVGVEEDVARLKGEVLVLRQERLVEQVVHAELVAEVRDYTQALAAAKNTLEQEQEQHRHGLERQQQEHRQIIDQYTRDDKDSPQENTVSDSIDMHSRIDFLEKERLRLEEVVERNARDMVAESAVQSELEAEIGSLERELVDVRRKAEAQTGTCLLEETVGQELKDRATQLQHEVDEALRKHKVQAREHQIITHEAEGVARGLRERILELEGEREEHDIAENEQQVHSHTYTHIHTHTHTHTHTHIHR